MSGPKDKSRGLSLNVLKAEYSYDCKTGIFSRIKKVNQAGDEVGWVNEKTGYRIITVNGFRYMAHRLAWFYVHGEWPRDRLDHRNCDNSDNRIANLREATDQQNTRNRRVCRSNRLGIKGVRLHESGKYQCRIFDGEKFQTKLCTSLDEAKAEHLRLSSKYFGDFARAA